MQNDKATTGLNLTACNNVILVDLWWNPALEVCRIRLRSDNLLAKPLRQDQAFGRAHRIGQKKPVNIWKLTIEGTVEERILAVRVHLCSPDAYPLILRQLQEKKRQLAESALSGEARSKAGTLGMDELMDLFKPSYDNEEDGDDDDD